MSSERECLAGFVDALRQFADYLEQEPDMACLDASGDLFVAAAALSYSGQFDNTLRSERQRLGSMLGRLNFGAWLYAFTGWCGAVAELAYRLKQKEMPGVAVEA